MMELMTIFLSLSLSSLYSTLLCVRNRGVGVARLDFVSGLRNCPIARLDFLSYLRNRAFFLRRLRRRPHREVFSRVLSIHTHKNNNKKGRRRGRALRSTRAPPPPATRTATHRNTREALSRSHSSGPNVLRSAGRSCGLAVSWVHRPRRRIPELVCDLDARASLGRPPRFLI